jgi:hypothetical protein
MPNTLRLSEALQIMENKDERFKVSFWTHNASAKTGGELVTIKNCSKAGVQKSPGNSGFISLVNNENSHHPIKVNTWLIHSLNNSIVIL